MIISCNSCPKSFVVPDSAITSKGRLVQCSSCGNKWTQYPISEQKIKKTSIKPKASINKKKLKEKKIKRSGPTLYSSEYLEEKHGIKISNKKIKSSKSVSKEQNSDNLGFGFYAYIITFFIIILSFFGILHLTKDIIVYNFPFLSVYIEHLFETIFNIKEIILNFSSSY